MRIHFGECSRQVERISAERVQRQIPRMKNSVHTQTANISLYVHQYLRFSWSCGQISRIAGLRKAPNAASLARTAVLQEGHRVLRGIQTKLPATSCQS